ncbi:unnamed protein product, partial [Phaeothamnion confervicola]
ISFGRLKVGLSPSSMWRGGAAFEEIRLEAPYVRLERRRDGSVNLSDFAPPPSNEKGPPLRLWINNLAVTDGRVVYSDLARPKPLMKSVDEIAFELTDFKTVGEGNPFSLSASGDRGEKVAWRGRFSLEPFSSDGVFDITLPNLPAIADWLGDAANFDLASGSIDAKGGYAFKLDGARPSLRADLSEVALTTVAVRERGAATDIARFERAVAADVHLS